MEQNMEQGLVVYNAKAVRDFFRPPIQEILMLNIFVEVVTRKKMAESALLCLMH